ncbi:MAG: hypothetical protein J2P36_33235, partial [Ktedonobacteraceae bacterium]|nr:hypothetical protein [Ktedonobacteraceae bacterium]
KNARSMIEIATCANALIGKEPPELPGYRVVRIIHFQVIHSQASGYDALVLVEVIGSVEETEQIALRAEDIEVIEELTSTVSDEPSEGTTHAG